MLEHFYINSFSRFVRRLRKNVATIRKGTLLVEKRHRKKWDQWVAAERYRRRLRAAVVKMLENHAVMHTKPYFSELKRHAVFERLAEEQLIRSLSARMHRVLRFFVTNAILQVRFHGSLVFNILQTKRRGLRALRFLATRAKISKQKSDNSVLHLMSFLVQRAFQSLYEYRCDIIADRFFKAKGKKRFFRALHSYWSLVTRNNRGIAFVDSKRNFLVFSKWKRCIRRRIRASRLLRRCWPYYLKTAARRYIRRMVRVARFNVRARRWAGVHDKHHLRRRKLLVVHLLDLAVNCKWARQELCRLQMMEARKNIIRKVFKALSKKNILANQNN
jgi:hypothetical protein